MYKIQINIFISNFLFIYKNNVDFKLNEDILQYLLITIILDNYLFKGKTFPMNLHDFIADTL